MDIITIDFETCHDGAYNLSERTQEAFLKGRGATAIGSQAQDTKKWCSGADLNHRHADFQSAALPTELPEPFLSISENTSPRQTRTPVARGIKPFFASRGRHFQDTFKTKRRGDL